MARFARANMTFIVVLCLVGSLTATSCSTSPHPITAIDITSQHTSQQRTLHKDRQVRRRDRRRRFSRSAQRCARRGGGFHVPPRPANARQVTHDPARFHAVR